MPPNHKSDIGSPQCSEARRLCFPQLRRRQALQSQPCDTAQGDRDGFRRGSRQREPRRRGKRPEPNSAPALYEQIAGPVFRALVQMVPHGYAMALGEIMERSAGYRAGSAAGGTAMASRQRPADADMSGMQRLTGSERRILPPPGCLAASGGKRNNAQQDANRRLPPGGNTGRRRSR
jgi:hypothetical protein